MAENYLGETPFDVKDTPFAKYEIVDWMMYFIERYGQFDGAHHKAWVLDQVARIRFGTPIEIVQANWVDHAPEWRVSLGEPSTAYLEWVKEMQGEWDEDNEFFEYGYEDGIAP